MAMAARQMAGSGPAAGRPIVAGYASLFNLPDSGGDVVMPGAFAKSLARRSAAGIRMLWQHDPARPIGRWLNFGEDRNGLWVTGRLTAGVSTAEDLARLIADKALDGLSIGFRTVRATSDPRRGIRLIHEIDLWEVSLVTFPMHPRARLVMGGPGGGEGGTRAALVRRLDEAARTMLLSMS
jgi:hypothetical protein